jgi:hypothetical protein
VPRLPSTRLDEVGGVCAELATGFIRVERVQQSKKIFAVRFEGRDYAEERTSRVDLEVKLVVDDFIGVFRGGARQMRRWSSKPCREHIGRASSKDCQVQYTVEAVFYWRSSHKQDVVSNRHTLSSAGIPSEETEDSTQAVTSWFTEACQASGCPSRCGWWLSEWLPLDGWSNSQLHPAELNLNHKAHFDEAAPNHGNSSTGGFLFELHCSIRLPRAPSMTLSC